MMTMVMEIWIDIFHEMNMNCCSILYNVLLLVECCDERITTATTMFYVFIPTPYLFL